MAAVTAGLTSAAGAQEPTGFLNRTVTVDGVSHRYQVYVPAGLLAHPAVVGDPVPARLGRERGTDGLLQTAVGLGEGIRRHAGRWPALVVFPQAPPEHRWQGTVAHLALATLDRTLQEFSSDGIPPHGRGAPRPPLATRPEAGGPLTSVSEIG